VELTQDGQMLLELVQPLVTEFESVRHLFEDRKRNVVHELRVAATANVLAFELKKPIHEFLDRHSRVRLNLIDCPSQKSLELLRDGKLDVAVVSHLEEDAWNPLLGFDFLFARPFFLLCPRRHALTRRRTLRLSDLVRYPMISGAKGSRFRTRIDRVFQKHGLLDKLHVVLETGNANVLAEYVALGLGISVVPRAIQRQDWRTLHFRSVASTFGEEQVLLAWKKGASELPQVAGFRAIVRQALGQPDGKRNPRER
jgi:DNA-binding transcriptional LysR family regulator